MRPTQRPTGPAALDAVPARRHLLVIAAPWVVAVALAAIGVATTRGAPAGAAMDEPEAPDDSARDTVPDDAPAPASKDDHTGRDVAAGAIPPAVQLGVLAAARAELGAAGLVGATGPAAERWPLEVVITAVTAVTDRAAIATVHGLVIERAPEGWTEPTVRAVAVPLLTDPTPAVAGAAWPLPDPPATTVAAPQVALDEPLPEVIDALEHAGWTVQEVTDIGAIGEELLHVRLTGTPPNRSRASPHEVWLLRDPGGPRALPLDPTAPAAPTVAPQDQP